MYLCIVGPDNDMPGGMREVMNQIKNSNMINLKLDKIIIPTASSRNKFKTFVCGFLKYIILCIRKKVAAVHINMSEGGSIYRTCIIIVASMFFRVKIFVHSHGSNFEKEYNGMNPIKKKVFKNIIGCADRVIVLTDGWKKIWGDIVSKNIIRVLPNGIHIPQRHHKVYYRNNRINLLFLGVVGQRKGIYDVIDAVGILKKRGYDISLKIGGNGEIEKCRQYVLEKNLQDIITICGWVSGDLKESLLDEADMLLLPSYYESFGIVLLEGMAHQLVVICGDGGYSKEIIEDGIDGYVVHSGNVIDIAKKIEGVYKDSSIYEIAENGYKKVAMHYAVDKIMRLLEKIYLEVII